MDNGQHYPPVAVTRARTDKPEELVRRVRNACAATVTRNDDTEHTVFVVMVFVSTWRG
jgi:hypothetical protein